jgi:hypothetical protein
MGASYTFDLARKLIDLAHDVLAYTDYPKFVAKRFGLPPDRVKLFPGSPALVLRRALASFQGSS